MKKKSFCVFSKPFIFVLIVCIILILSVCVEKADLSLLWGKPPIEFIENYHSDTEDVLAQGNIDNISSYQIEADELTYHDNLDIWEESLSGGGTPIQYTDGDGNKYTKKFFTSLGYTMYIPDGWERLSPSNSYMQNLYYLVSKKPGYENIQISVATKGNTSKLSPNEAIDNFITTQQGLEYYYLNGAYKLSVAMYTPGELNQISTSDIPGFEDLDNHQVLVYYDEPEVTFTYDKDPTYYANPYVLNYYIIKEDVSIMLTAIGPKKESASINYLMASMGLNCKEIISENATGIRYEPKQSIETGLLTANIPEEWFLGTGNDYVKRIVCSDEPSNPLYGTEILISSKILTDKNLTGINDVMRNESLQKTLVFSAMKYSPDLSEMITRNLDYSISFTVDNENKQILDGKEFCKVDYKITIDENSLMHPIALIENPFCGRIYIAKYGEGYIFVSLKTTCKGQSYIDDLANSLFNNVYFT